MLQIIRMSSDRGRNPNKHELNCTLPAILEFPNLMRRKSVGWTITVFLLTVYLFVGLAIVCDNYLVPAMERLCFCTIYF